MDIPSKRTSNYDMRSGKRGRCIILNHDKFESLPSRKGTSVDVENLRNTFKNLNFEVAIHIDNTTDEINQKLSHHAESYNREDFDCLFLVVLTHGDSNGLLHSRNGKYHQSLLWKPFLSDKCPGLSKKPKVIIIQACRGDQVDNGFTMELAATDSIQDPYYKIPPEPHFCLFYSTTEGYYSWRNVVEGSWLVKTLCEELQSPDDEEKDLMTVMLRVSYRIAYEMESENMDPEKAGKKQMPSILCTLTRRLCLRNEVFNGIHTGRGD